MHCKFESKYCIVCKQENNVSFFFFFLKTKNKKTDQIKLVKTFFFNQAMMKSFRYYFVLFFLQTYFMMYNSTNFPHHISVSTVSTITFSELQADGTVQHQKYK